MFSYYLHARMYLSRCTLNGRVEHKESVGKMREYRHRLSHERLPPLCPCAVAMVAAAACSRGAPPAADGRVNMGGARGDRGSRGLWSRIDRSLARGGQPVTGAVWQE